MINIGPISSKYNPV